METRNLLKLALITALIGTFFVIILALNLEPQARGISSINEKSLDEWAKIQGRVVQQRDVEGIEILTVNDGTASINAIQQSKNYSYQGLNVEILGKIIEYKGNIEIDVSRIRVLGTG